MDTFTTKITAEIKIGILALQGDVAEHANSIRKLGALAVPVKYERDLDTIDGLIIPGGESTTISKLTNSPGASLFSHIKQLAGNSGLPVYGTCMGSIMLAKSIDGARKETLSLMDITVKRNAYGPQKASFETYITIEQLGQDPFQAIFIRAPQIISAGQNVEVLAKVDDTIVAAKQNNLLATTFHPELVSDTRIHSFFLKMVIDSKESQTKYSFDSNNKIRMKLQA